MPRRRFKRATLGKTYTKHADSFMNNVGPGSVPTSFTMVETDAGVRAETHQVIQANADTDATCMVGDMIKYLNVHIQVAGRGSDDDNTMGWLEYAIIYKKESDANLTIAQLGTQTLGETATNLYRGDCWWTGEIPVGIGQPNGAEIPIKVPKNRQILKIGDQFNLVCYFRSQNSASVSTTTTRLIQSVNFRCYN